MPASAYNPPAGTNSAPRQGLDQGLFVLRLIGLLGFLGGLLALSALWAFGPRPADQAQWRLMLRATQAIFFPCVFAGIVLLVIVGSILWWRHRTELHGSRWFRLMMWLLLAAVPVSHLAARGTMLKLKDAVEAGNLAQAGILWDRMGLAYVLSTIALAIIASIGVIKPRLGQRTRSAQAGIAQD